MRRVFLGTKWARVLVLAALLCVTAVPAVLAQEEEAGEEEGAQILPFLEERDEGNLAVDREAHRADALALYDKALFLFKNRDKRRPFWGETTDESTPAKHSHLAALDGVGNGVTSTEEGHAHDVKLGMVQEAAGHTHQLKSASAPEGCGPLKRPYFYFALGLTYPGEEGHQHVITGYAKGAMQTLSSWALEHAHLAKHGKFEKPVKRGRRQLENYKDSHTHEIRWIAKHYFDSDAYQHMADQFEDAARKSKDFAQAYFYECIAQQRILEQDQALKNADKALRALDGFHEAIVERGDVQMWLGNFDKAHDNYRQALATKPGYAHAHFMDAMCYLREGDFGAAEKAFTTARDSGRKETEAAFAELRKKAEEHLPEGKRGAFFSFLDFLLKGDLENLNTAREGAESSLEGAERHWLNKAQSLADEYLGAVHWLKELEKEKTFPGWGGYVQAEEDNYVVKGKPGEMSQTLIDYFAGQLESAYKLYRMRFKKQAPQKTPINVYIYADHKSYVKDGAPPSSGGYANPYLRKMVWPINGRDYTENGFNTGATPTTGNLQHTLLVLFHEAFHQYLNKFIPNAPQCFNEGCADYFGPSKFEVRKVGSQWTGDLVVRVNPWRLQHIKQMLSLDIHLPFEAFWKMTKGEMYSGRFQGMNYAQAWAWVFFLFERVDGKGAWEEVPETKKGARKHFKLLGDYYAALAKGKGLNGAWDASFGRLKGRQLAALEEEWKDFTNRLKEKQD